MNKQETKQDEIKNSENFDLGPITSGQKEKAKKLISDYVGESDGEKFEQYFESYPNLAVGYFDESGEVIGVCFGFPRDKKTVLLQGIAIHSDYSSAGLGSKLIKLFEEAVVKSDYHKITLGSAEGYVEHFYIKNGYKLTEFMVTVVGDAKVESVDGFIIKGSRKEGDKTIYYVSNEEGYKPEQKDELKKLFGASQVIYLFEKEL